MPKLNPLLESDSVECAHKGKILAFSNNKLLEVDGSCVLTKQDLLQAQNIGCTHQVAGFSTPCKAIVTITDSALSNTLIINGDSAIIAQQISQIFTDNGAPLRFKNGATPKAKDIFEVDEDIADFDNAQNNNGNAESMSESNQKSSAESNESNSKTNAKSNTDSSNSQSTQDSQKEIIEMYFSYGDECKRIKTDSKIEGDVNLHIKTMGYKNGETLDLQGNLNGKYFSIKATIHNNQAVIMNIFQNQE